MIISTEAKRSTWQSSVATQAPPPGKRGVGQFPQSGQGACPEDLQPTLHWACRVLSPLGVPSALPRRAPSGQLLTILPAVHLVQEQSGDKMETRKIGKAAIKRPTHRCQTVYVESPGGPSENSLIRKSTISRGKDVWMYETSLVLLYVFKWKSELRKPAVS